MYLWLSLTLSGIINEFVNTGRYLFMYRYKSIFVSDVHLGTKSCQAELLLDFIEQAPSEKLFLVGDIIDLWALRPEVLFPTVACECHSSDYEAGQVWNQGHLYHRQSRRVIS